MVKQILWKDTCANTEGVLVGPSIEKQLQDQVGNFKYIFSMKNWSCPPHIYIEWSFEL